MDLIFMSDNGLDRETKKKVSLFLSALFKYACFFNAVLTMGFLILWAVNGVKPGPVITAVWAVVFMFREYKNYLVWGKAHNHIKTKL